ncbi:MAG: glycosyl hydrolase [Acidimicrobiia bacterium]|nr:glycosyl hydrolase [Acidimicrobiia bacterium]
MRTASVGALAVSHTNPEIIYAGMGEACIRNDVSPGDGVYRSRDGGDTWAHTGLADTRHIGEILVDPFDPERVYVAALGHAFGSNPERGIYRTLDGGDTWQRVLHTSTKAGAIDITMDARSRDILYAAVWEARRTFWNMSSGGPDSGIWRSTDGADSWTEITQNEGLPQSAIIGRVGLAASGARPGRLWALIESSEAPGLYRSDDFGRTWSLVSAKRELRNRPFYFTHVKADPLREDRVYVLNSHMWRSDDGGVGFNRIATQHDDNHDLWIDPGDNLRMISANDGGANVSFDGGASWSTVHNQLTAQIYRLDTDNRAPYFYVYGTQQDNSTIAVPSGTTDGAITMVDCCETGTGESGSVAVHPDDHNTVVVGGIGSSPGRGAALQHYDHRSEQIRLVNIWPEAHDGVAPSELKYRFHFTFPVLFSAQAAGNVVFNSRDIGDSWEVISPDLSRDDPEKQQLSGGPIKKETSGAEDYCTIAALSESPLEPELLWAGSDDGLVHLSRDRGANWEDVTPPDLPEWTFVKNIEPSRHRPGTAYLAATRYMLDDFRPFLLRTDDHGRTWVSIVGEGDEAIPAEDFVRVVRSDPIVDGLLYAGTETGLYVSVDDGSTWLRWPTIPNTPVYDLKVQGSDLAVATHGRGFWIADDLAPLRRLAQDPSLSGDFLFTPKKTWRVLPHLTSAWVTAEGKDYWTALGKAATFVAQVDETGQVERRYLDAGSTGPTGATVHYYLSDATASDPGVVITLDFLDGNQGVVWSIRSTPDGDLEGVAPRAPKDPGMCRFVWDLRHEGAMPLPGGPAGGEADRGPLIVPGEYEVRLTVQRPDGSASAQTAPLVVVNDPRREVSQEDLERQLSAKISEARYALARLREARRRIEHLAGTGNMASRRAEAVLNELASVERELIVVPGDLSDTFGRDEKALIQGLTTLISVIASADAKPTKQALSVVSIYFEQIDAHLAHLQQVLDVDFESLHHQVGD